jgi:hypothetical protein
MQGLGFRVVGSWEWAFMFYVVIEKTMEIEML